MSPLPPPQSTTTTPMEDDEEDQAEIERSEASVTYHPCPPSHELFDIQTTVDPSYIISLIRKLLPHNVKGNVNGDGSIRGSENGDVAVSISALVDAMEITNNVIDRLSSGKESGECCEALAEEEAAWEEYGCILWDLAADKTQSEFMVDNLLLEVILASLTVSRSLRVTEISLGMLGNLACHEVPINRIVSTEGLVDTIVNQLFLDDSPSLCETCRLLTLGLQGGGSAKFVEVLQPEHILCRILWIAENTLNPLLLEKSIGLLLAMVDNEHVAKTLLPALMSLGLSNLLTSLLASELNKLSSERISDRYSILDVILRVVEALSTMDDYSKQLSTNKKLLQQIFELVKLPDKVEVSTLYVTAAFIIANIITDEPYLASDISQDVSLLQGLLDIIPFISDDLEARSALWTVLGKVLTQVQEDAMNPSTLHQYLSVLVEKSDLIQDDLIDHQQEDSSEDHSSSNTTSSKSIGRIASLKKIVSILNRWSAIVIDHSDEDVVAEANVDARQVDKLLRCCRKYTM